MTTCPKCGSQRIHLEDTDKPRYRRRHIDEPDEGPDPLDYVVCENCGYKVTVEVWFK